MSDDNVTPINAALDAWDKLPVAYRSWILLDRGGREVKIENTDGHYIVIMRGRFKGRQTVLRVPFSPENMRSATKAAGIIHVFDRIAEAMVKRYNRNASALNNLNSKELRRLEKTRDSKVLNFSNPVRDPGDVPRE